MFDFVAELFSGLTWRSVLVGVLIFLATFFLNLGIVSVILVKLPKDHFKREKSKGVTGSNATVRVLKVIGKNVAGWLLIALGIVLSVPGVPGQGLLTILLGVMLVDFPGKHRLEQKLLSRPGIIKTINRLRGRFGKPALELD
jgi:archaellum biogenesis protein FlaJ (TadC family)